MCETWHLHTIPVVNIVIPLILLVFFPFQRFSPQLRFSKMKGVARCVVGYSGGKTPDPTYKKIRDHTEAVLVEYNPNQVSYEDLVVSWTQMHLPNNSKGKCQYRSAVWYLDDEQKEIADEVVQQWKASNSRELLYTSVEAARTFYRAEEYHQYFLSKRMGTY
jgi:peptide-methionine (S)-S-oxide reductase